MDKNDPRKPPTDEELKGLNENWTDSDTAEVNAPEAPAQTPFATATQPPVQPTTAPELGRPAAVPQLIKSTAPATPLTVEPVGESELADEEAENEGLEEPAGEYDPNRGDRVDVLNDTTPPPRPQPVAAPKQKRRKKLWPWLVILLLLIGGGAYFVLVNHKASAPAVRQVTTTPKVTTTAPATITTKHYSSTTYSMGMDYPTTWKLNDGDTNLSVTSPAISLKKSDGTQASGYIQLSIEAKQTSLPEFAKGAALAAIASEQLTYTKPTPNQRTATNLTFASYSTTTGNGWDALYVTGGNAYAVGQTIPMTDIIQTDPLVQVHFLTCTDQTCAGTPTALSLQASEWKNTAVSQPLKTIIQSFSFN